MTTGKKGKIYLVGAGPGDPELATLKAVRAIREADALVYDYLVNPALLDHASPEAERIYVGKQAGRHTMPQEEINRLLVRLASGGLVVTRLKGGDPFVFGRGGEEALAAVEAGIEFEVVPGVTAGVAVPAYAGIPVTQRGITTSVTFVTGHEDPGKEESEINWANLAVSRGTLVFYMGVSRLGHISRSLIGNGMSARTPVAAIHRGTTARQRTVAGTLDNIETRVLEAGLTAPAIIVVGEVTALSGKLQWFETRPLFGRTVIVTRSREQASDFSRLLAEKGARVIELPTIRISDSPDRRALDAAIRKLPEYDWIVFTSVNGVKRFMYYLNEAGQDVRALGKASLCAIGPSTADALREMGLRVDMLPEKFVAEAVVEEFRKIGDLAGRRVLLPRAEIARKVLPDSLRDMGASVDEVPVYSTVAEAPENLDEVLEELRAGRVDAVTFTSSSTVDNFVGMLGSENLTSFTPSLVFAAIGPITAKTASEHGLSPLISAQTHTVGALAELLEEHFRRVGDNDGAVRR